MGVGGVCKYVFNGFGALLSLYGVLNGHFNCLGGVELTWVGDPGSSP